MAAAAWMWSSYAWGSLSFVLYVFFVFVFTFYIIFKEGNKENVLGKKGKVFTKLGKIGLNYFFKNIWTSKN
jgi:hypothetical protein